MSDPAIELEPTVEPLQARGGALVEPDPQSTADETSVVDGTNPKQGDASSVDGNAVGEPPNSAPDVEGRVYQKESRWHTRIGTIAGISGLLLSLLLGIRTVYQEAVNEEWQRRQDLTDVVEKLTELNLRAMELSAKLSGSAGPSQASQNELREVMRPLANQRFILLNQAKRIVDGLSEPPTLELSVLAESYVGQLDYETAEKYLRAVADTVDDPAVAASGHRSLGTLAFIRGPAFLEAGRESFRAATALLSPRQDVTSLGFLFDVTQVWAESELAFGFPAEALSRALDAGVLCKRMPCIPQRSQCAGWSRQMIRRAVASKPDLALVAAQAETALSQATDPRAIWCADEIG